MALDPNKLSQALQQLTKNRPANAVAAGHAWARAYANYTRDAISPLGGSPVGVDVAEQLLASTLAGLFSTSVDATTLAYGAAAGFSAFWFVPPMVFTGTPPGLVTVVIGAPILPLNLFATLQTNFLSKASDAAAFGRIAADLDAFTRTVVVTHPVVPTPVVGPIT